MLIDDDFDVKNIIYLYGLPYEKFDIDAPITIFISRAMRSGRSATSVFR